MDTLYPEFCSRCHRDTEIGKERGLKLFPKKGNIPFIGKNVFLQKIPLLSVKTFFIKNTPFTPRLSCPNNVLRSRAFQRWESSLTASCPDNFLALFHPWEAVGQLPYLEPMKRGHLQKKLFTAIVVKTWHSSRFPSS